MYPSHHPGREIRMRIGLDVGSTTLKTVVLNDAGEILYKKYERHFGKVREKACQMLSDLHKTLNVDQAALAVSGSAGMGLAERGHLSFVQEVYATKIAVEKRLNGADAVIELGGEDAKILFLTGEDGQAGSVEVRMNGSCAGGTGAFIDQMATLLNCTPGEMNELAAHYEKIYTIASRCGVFAKSDIQPLLNQGTRKTDIAASIFDAVVNQTIAGLAQGRPIAGRVVYLGGPLTFLDQLRARFDATLGVKGLCPEDSLYFVAIGAALMADKACPLSDCIRAIELQTGGGAYLSCKPLFTSQEEYDAFCARHAKNAVPTVERPGYDGRLYVGVDAGSTTVKAVVIDEDENILMQRYLPSNGNPVGITLDFLKDMYDAYPRARVAGASSTGYGEEIVKHAFNFDGGLVETIAHFMAARKLDPQVNFIIDIGGQDIKCFHIREGVVDNIFLNEACSSGCGSFLQTFAGSWGMSIQEFAEKGVFAPAPVDLGSRCTVFMNSSVKQAQKDGASLENISAGLSISVVKNALYKVLRLSSADELGRHVVVQGGTFLNNAVLRAFEQEIGREVTRPNIAGLMGAYGAALNAKALGLEKSAIISREALDSFTRSIQVTVCNGCSNHCRLTINSFGGGRRYISGNRCEKPNLGVKKPIRLDLYAFKQRQLLSYASKPGNRGRIGIPMGLNMYELYPFWHTFFTQLGFEVVPSPASNRALYLSGQHTIPSDTVCYPAKLMHGHIEALLGMGVDAIFYPCMTYNVDEDRGDNHYNCPVVAYYPEVIAANVRALSQVKYINCYVGLHRPRDFEHKIYGYLSAYWPGITRGEVRAAAHAAYAEYARYMDGVRKTGAEYINKALAQGMPVIVLSGRPYHLDPEINHGIDQLVCELGAAVVSEDAVNLLVERFPTRVLNQWTYHARLYSAARYVAQSRENIHLVQLVSFGCGVDAITSDEVRSILERAGKIYTQIKIDEITNLGAVKIRLRSLFAALSQNGGKKNG